ncbi:hypothetical protein JX265_008093 [Neoarthrinium moseri]|uniref:Uncharacterized protein n=1 Tax=Neoarthrinium moseri TaxID=1658444 RepID=A0A9P9WJ32_9PEZI|nr:uncharacterized protein JN550_004462 [Neoarthrinium moseri]KAI1849755.1 hypothetical protein JX266_004704 [Neoarthrinium moseri]KAI1865770.1 hypothetical protein JX265_008093 [Neoarthrinium moseri]KAI1871468.1 hypothetical protein JN550_004462 [Neoarthrinium moseri]
MYAFKSLAALALIAGLAQASPAPEPIIKLVKMCDKPHLQGSCFDFQTEIEVCKNLTPNIDNKLSSFDTGLTFCDFYKDKGCAGDNKTFRGKQEELPAEYNNKISSVKCRNWK